MGNFANFSMSFLRLVLQISLKLVTFKRGCPRFRVICVWTERALWKNTSL